MQWLDANPNVSAFLYEKLAIPYLSNKRTGKVRNYLPDLLVTFVSGDRQLIEIKPKSKLNQVKVKKKTAAAKAWCKKNDVEFVIITEKELKELKLLK